MKKSISNAAFVHQFERNSKKTLKINVAPRMYRGGIRL